MGGEFSLGGADPKLKEVFEVSVRGLLHFIADGCEPFCKSGAAPALHSEVDVFRRPGFGPVAKLHRVPALEEPREIRFGEEARQQPLDGELQAKIVDRNAPSLCGLRESVLKGCSERGGCGKGPRHSRIIAHYGAIAKAASVWACS